MAKQTPLIRIVCRDRPLYRQSIAVHVIEINAAPKISLNDPLLRENANAAETHPPQSIPNPIAREFLRCGIDWVRDRFSSCSSASWPIKFEWQFVQPGTASCIAHFAGTVARDL